MLFKFKKGAKQEIGTEDPWYALTSGGYLKPEEVIEDASQLKHIREAIATVEAFIQQCYDESIIEEA